MPFAVLPTISLERRELEDSRPGSRSAITLTAQTKR